ncbi:MAG: 50S ribosomal protein L11 [archaeon GB-1867-097]|nr:50S ribosomal protein L11 [Candidatus Verstraetearchaeota archaeon]MCS7373756.1 50S ribosomal protein L11 [Candidatus Culexmicrobium thermophilum]MCS7384869.1 50S ribosomal protein L11 [Candidatus Culexmicrobium thermophilum]HDO20685.1 50S ribosomal protein L11 [Candidatus Bathyarchaeota archaeon]
MGAKKTFNFLIEGGKATGGPPIGPSLGPLGVNIMAIVNRINQLTKEFAGMRVPVKVEVDIDTKEFEVTVGIPTTAALIIKEVKAEKGSGTPHEKKIGNLTLEQVIKIAKIKRPQLLANSLKAAVKEILGTCVSMGVTVENKDPKMIQKEIDEGIHGEVISKYEEAES